MPKSGRALRGWMQRGYGGDPGEVWLVRGEPGVDAWYRLGLPDRANRDRASLHILVRPSARRRGLGTELMHHATQRAQVNGRVVITGDVLEGFAG